MPQQHEAAGQERSAHTREPGWAATGSRHGAGKSPDTLGPNAQPCCDQLAPLCLSFPFQKTSVMPGMLAKPFVKHSWEMHSKCSSQRSHSWGLWGGIPL